MQNRNLPESFYFALRGVIYVILTQRNMRLHCVLAVLALFLGFYFNINTFSLMLVIFAIFLVLITEMFNTAIESTVDLYTRKQKQLAALAKDVAAGAVLMAALNAAVLGYLVFFEKLNFTFIEWSQHFLNILTDFMAVSLLGVSILIFLFICFRQKCNFNTAKSQIYLHNLMSVLTGVLISVVIIISEHFLIALFVAVVFKKATDYLLFCESLTMDTKSLILVLTGIIVGFVFIWFI